MTSKVAIIAIVGLALFLASCAAEAVRKAGNDLKRSKAAYTECLRQNTIDEEASAAKLQKGLERIFKEVGLPKSFAERSRQLTKESRQIRTELRASRARFCQGDPGCLAKVYPCPELKDIYEIDLKTFQKLTR